MANQQFVKAHATVRATRKLLAQSRTQGFKQTNSVIDAIYGNLSTTERGLGRQLGAAQARQLSAIERLQANARAKNTSLAQGTQRAVRNRYGSAIGAGTDFSGVTAQGKAGKLDAAGQARASGLISQGNTAAVNIAKAGASQAQAGAEYATAQALQYRAKNDAQLIAQQTLELQKMRLQNQLDLQNYKRKLELEKKAEGISGMDGLTSVTGTLTDDAGAMRTLLATGYTDPTTKEHVNFTSAGDLASYFASTHPATQTDENYVKAVAMLAQSVFGSTVQSADGTWVTRDGYERSNEAQDVLDVVSQYYDVNQKQGDRLHATVDLGLQSYYEGLALNAPQGSQPMNAGGGLFGINTENFARGLDVIQGWERRAPANLWGVVSGSALSASNY